MGCNCNHHSGCHTQEEKKKKSKNLPVIISLIMLGTGMGMNHFGWFTLPGSALVWYAIATSSQAGLYCGKLSNSSVKEIFSTNSC